MGWIGCYALDLYCDKRGDMGPDGTDGIHAFEEFPHQFTAELGSAARSEARKAGWILSPSGGAVCPKCSGKKDERPKRPRTPSRL